VERIAWSRLIAAVVCMALLAGCGGSASSDPNSTVLEGKEGRPDVSVPVGAAPKKLVYEDLEEGTGRPAKAGDELSVRYFRISYDDHRLYEDRWREPAPPFILGTGQMVEPWEEGLPGVKEGGRRELIVPAKMTFAKKPEIYVIEVLSIKAGKGLDQVPAPVIRVKGTGSKPKLHYPSTEPNHVISRVLKEGSGPVVRRGDSLIARFVSGNVRTKEVVQEFWGKNDLYRFKLGENRLGNAWVVGMKGMRLGGRRELIVPSRLAYGDGAMVYVIELLGMEQREPARAG
jgi:peptidylprolyl isomerase